MLEKTLESPWDSKEVNQPIVKESNPEYSLEKTLRLGGQKKRVTEDEMAGWHH